MKYLGDCFHSLYPFYRILDLLSEESAPVGKFLGPPLHRGKACWNFVSFDFEDCAKMSTEERGRVPETVHWMFYGTNVKSCLCFERLNVFLIRNQFIYNLSTRQGRRQERARGL